MSAAPLLAQLEQIRQACFNDAGNFKATVPKILYLVAPEQPLEQKRWGAAFLAECFASPLVSQDDKLALAIQAMPTVKGYFDNTDEDAAVIKGSVQVATSIYPLIFRHIIGNPNDGQTWQNMAAVKLNILRRMDSSPSGVRIACVKFVQRVIQVQTQGLISDPRNPDQNEISLALVQNHSILDPKKLEAEAQGLLDRLLYVFQEAQSDALYVSATLNCLIILVRTRPSIANRIITTIFNFNPVRTPPGPVSAKTKLVMRSMEKTVGRFFTTLAKSGNSSPQFQQRVEEYLNHIRAQRQAAIDDNRKRAAPTAEPTDGLSDAKRAKLTEEPPPSYPPLPAGPISLAQLFTLNPDPRVLNFDAKSISENIVLRCIEPLLSAVPQKKFDDAINAVRQRWLSRATVQPPPLDPSPQAAGSLTNVAPGGPDLSEEGDFPAEGPISAPTAPPFRLPQPPPRTPVENDAEVQYRVNRMFARLRTFSDAGTSIDVFLKKGPPVVTRRAANTDDRDSWATLMLRTALRGKIGRSKPGVQGYTEDRFGACLATLVRENLLKWILENFRRRLDVAALWMNEEYLLQADHAAASDEMAAGPLGAQYERWSLRLVDGMMPYVDANDWKYVTRFYSEVPRIGMVHVERLGRMARDPDRVSCALRVLQYLIIYKPPCRNACLDVVEDMYKNNEPARAEAAKILFDRRAHALADEDRERLEKQKADRAAAAAAKARPTPAPDAPTAADAQGEAAPAATTAAAA